VTHSHLDETDAAGDALGRAHDAADAARLEAFDEAEDVRATRSFWRELPILVLVALVLAVLLKTFVMQAFYIPSSSMEETLEINDRVLVSKVSYVFGDIERGDVVVFDDPYRSADSSEESLIRSFFRNLAESIGLSTHKSEFIKRVIALPGETVEVRDGSVFVDGTVLREHYLDPARSGGDFGPQVVPPDHIFVMGDNRGASQDSRVFGPVPIDDVVGRAFSVIWPPGNWRGL
jgi:signal peptidase I